MKIRILKESASFNKRSSSEIYQQTIDLIHNANKEIEKDKKNKRHIIQRTLVRMSEVKEDIEKRMDIYKEYQKVIKSIEEKKEEYEDIATMSSDPVLGRVSHREEMLYYLDISMEALKKKRKEIEKKAANLSVNLKDPEGLGILENSMELISGWSEEYDRMHAEKSWSEKNLPTFRKLAGIKESSTVSGAAVQGYAGKKEDLEEMYSSAAIMGSGGGGFPKERSPEGHKRYVRIRFKRQGLQNFKPNRYFRSKDQQLGESSSEN